MTKPLSLETGRRRPSVAPVSSGRSSDLVSSSSAPSRPWQASGKCGPVHLTALGTSRICTAFPIIPPQDDGHQTGTRLSLSPGLRNGRPQFHEVALDVAVAAPLSDDGRLPWLARGETHDALAQKRAVTTACTDNLGASVAESQLRQSRSWDWGFWCSPPQARMSKAGRRARDRRW
jgi:hypothetical protein